MASDFLGPSNLDQLLVGGQLGRGVTSSVKVAVSRDDPSQLFALKAVKKARITGQKQLEHLFREKQLLCELRDPSVVGFHGTFKDETHLYFLLELLDGGELLWHMRRCPCGRVPAESARLCLAGVLLPLQFMQGCGVLYRDIKPTNIIFSRLGKWVLQGILTLLTQD
jgi:serine/threonine protein kinase